MFESLLSSFIQGILFALIFSFIESLIGSRRLWILTALIISACFFLALQLSGLSFIHELGQGFLQWEALALLIGMFFGNPIGEYLGKQWKKK